MRLITEGNDGLVISGTTGGESPTLSKQEKLDLFKVIKERVGSRAQIFAGTGLNDSWQQHVY